jgi:hypothetical protein
MHKMVDDLANLISDKEDDLWGRWCYNIKDDLEIKKD